VGHRAFCIVKHVWRKIPFKKLKLWKELSYANRPNVLEQIYVTTYIVDAYLNLKTHTCFESGKRRILRDKLENLNPMQLVHAATM